jgi:hypothetical protein
VIAAVKSSGIEKWSGAIEGPLKSSELISMNDEDGRAPDGYRQAFALGARDDQQGRRAALPDSNLAAIAQVMTNTSHLPVLLLDGDFRVVPQAGLLHPV